MSVKYKLSVETKRLETIEEHLFHDKIAWIPYRRTLDDIKNCIFHLYRFNSITYPLLQNHNLSLCEHGYTGIKITESGEFTFTISGVTQFETIDLFRITRKGVDSCIDFVDPLHSLLLLFSDIFEYISSFRCVTEKELFDLISSVLRRDVYIPSIYSFQNIVKENSEWYSENLFVQTVIKKIKNKVENIKVLPYIREIILKFYKVLPILIYYLIQGNIIIWNDEDHYEHEVNIFSHLPQDLLKIILDTLAEEVLIHDYPQLIIYSGWEYCNDGYLRRTKST